MKRFEEIKCDYLNARDEQRKKIVDYMNNSKLNYVAKSRGYGVKNYTSNGNLNPSYDLSNFKYIKATKGNVNVFISLQAFEVDPVSQNHHILMDRLGIYVYDGIKDKLKDSHCKMIVSKFELPLSNEDLEELVLTIDNMIKNYN